LSADAGLRGSSEWRADRQGHQRAKTRAN
jgi:hypothetical protein